MGGDLVRMDPYGCLGKLKVYETPAGLIREGWTKKPQTFLSGAVGPALTWTPATLNDPSGRPAVIGMPRTRKLACMRLPVGLCSAEISE